MVRLADLPPTKRESMQGYACPSYGHAPSVAGGPLNQRTVTLVSTAGLVVRGERAFTPRDTRYRALPHEVPDADLLMTHVSVNFDRSGWIRDPDVVLPRRRLSELAAEGVIGAVADSHYSFMGATEAALLEPAAAKLAAELHHNGVDTALLVPI